MSELLSHVHASPDGLVPVPSWHYESAPEYSSSSSSDGSSSMPLEQALLWCYDLRSPKGAQLVQLLWDLLPDTAKAQKCHSISLTATSRVSLANGKSNAASNGPASRTSHEVSHSAVIDQGARSNAANGDVSLKSLDSSNGSMQPAAVIKAYTTSSDEDVTCGDDVVQSKDDAATCKASWQVTKLKQLMTDKEALESYLADRHIIDVLTDFPLAKISALQVRGFWKTTLRVLAAVLHGVQSSIYPSSSLVTSATAFSLSAMCSVELGSAQSCKCAIVCH